MGERIHQLILSWQIRPSSAVSVQTLGAAVCVLRQHVTGEGQRGWLNAWSLTWVALDLSCSTWKADCVSKDTKLRPSLFPPAREGQSCSPEKGAVSACWLVEEKWCKERVNKSKNVDLTFWRTYWSRYFWDVPGVCQRPRIFFRI